MSGGRGSMGEGESREEVYLVLIKIKYYHLYPHVPHVMCQLKPQLLKNYVRQSVHYAKANPTVKFTQIPTNNKTNIILFK
jgi:hypothetical protein